MQRVTACTLAWSSRSGRSGVPKPTAAQTELLRHVRLLANTASRGGAAAGAAAGWVSRERVVRVQRSKRDLGRRSQWG